MTKQNIYDNEQFFNSYIKIRERENNHNDIIERPTMLELLPDVQGKTILDLGCGYGYLCRKLVELGASKIVGIDISTKMLEVAKKENSHKKIQYFNIDMENIESLSIKFDVVVSSLALQYVENYSKLVKDVYNLLKDKGYFLYSCEHPLTTAYYADKNRYTEDENGNRLHANVYDYSLENLRSENWFVDEVEKYHRTFSTLTNELLAAGFSLRKIVEPIADEKIISKYPKFRNNKIRPDFIFFKAQK